MDALSQHVALQDLGTLPTKVSRQQVDLSGVWEMTEKKPKLLNTLGNVASSSQSIWGGRVWLLNKNNKILADCSVNFGFCKFMSEILKSHSKPLLWFLTAAVLLRILPVA